MANVDGDSDLEDKNRLKQGNLAMDKQNYALAIEHEPDNLDWYYNRSVAHFYLRKYRQAKADLEKILATDPDYPNAKQNLRAVRSRM